jgi:hypothetical protein
LKLDKLFLQIHKFLKRNKASIDINDVKKIDKPPIRNLIAASQNLLEADEHNQQELLKTSPEREHFSLSCFYSDKGSKFYTSA